MPPRKVVLLGDFGVGKTSFGTRLADDEFRATTLATLGVAHFMVSVQPAYNPLAPAVKLEIWDTAGQERYRSLDTLRLYLRRAAGAIVVLDCARADSLAAAARVVEQLRTDADLDCPPDLPIALACNKCDLGGRVVAAEAVAALARKHNLCDARDTSCKTGEGVLDLARALVAALPAADESAAPSSAGLVLPGAGEPAASSSGCC
mmetsp:Transcript_6606/g.19492  ORF Transcript_6606/g.19492 Transcript_6606/m.19492 type:complete len:205 (-) Transcript_6606:52-666(-)|eukprot:CAMPEP_0119267698 /NCGR_PEP_ID=MMETSP1329-20130426/5746_1 /TAXON_ID=114041 /ORGANISM="Genus nov. species nov., Strain RCC1024" /LENGTH=204 /DNA_ID=CAMNT_0007267635 /DNA_START=113 /DNA_END=727 /DNA_ORIENTATION=-